jgi:molecular chaperone DnaJ
MNIFSTVPVSFVVAALGGEILIDTVDGKVAYEVKAGTQTDTRVRLRGKGVPSLRSKDIRGDHYVTLVVQVPDKLSNEAKELLRQFDRETGNSLEAVKNMESSDFTKDKKKDKKKGLFNK